MPKTSIVGLKGRSPIKPGHSALILTEDEPEYGFVVEAPEKATNRNRFLIMTGLVLNIVSQAV